MKTLLKVLIAAAMLLLLLAACASNDSVLPHWELSEDILLISDNSDELLFKIAEDTLTNSGATFIIENTGDEELSFGQMYSLQKYIKNKWYKIEKYTDWTAELFTLQPDENYSFDADRTQTYGLLPPGRYRLIKEFSVSHFPMQVACEFTIS
jgi:hypothetical protein